MPEGVPRHVIEARLSAGLLESEPEILPLTYSLRVVENVLTFAQAEPTVDHSHRPVVQRDFQHATILPHQHFDDGVIEVHLLPFDIQNFSKPQPVIDRERYEVLQILNKFFLVSLDLQCADIGKLRGTHSRIQMRYDLFVPEPRTLVGLCIVQILLTELGPRDLRRLSILTPLDFR